MNILFFFADCDTFKCSKLKIGVKTLMPTLVLVAWTLVNRMQLRLHVINCALDWFSLLVLATSTVQLQRSGTSNFSACILDWINLKIIVKTLMPTSVSVAWTLVNRMQFRLQFHAQLVIVTHTCLLTPPTGAALGLTLIGMTFERKTKCSSLAPSRGKFWKAQ